MTRLSAIVLLLLSTVAYGQTTPISNLTATWNNGATTFNAIKMDITDTTSAAGSSALWLGFSATEVFRVDKDGTIYASSVAMPTINSTSTLTNKTLAFGSNTITGTEAQFDTALTDGNFAFSGEAFHDGFSDFVANEHIDHTSVTLTAGTGLDGGGDISANRTFDIDTTVATLTGSQVLSNKTLTLPQINDTSSDHQYVFGVSELAADRTVTLPLLAGNDTFVFNVFAATLTNKTIDAASNTLTLFAGGANNQLLTDDGSGGLVSESGLIFDGAKLGIGAAPAAQLDITAATSTVGFNIDLDATPGDALTVTDSGSSVLLTVDGAGQLRLGTGSPGYKLEVDGTGDFGGVVSFQNGARGQLTWGDVNFNSAGNFILRANGTHWLGLGGGANNSHMIITNGGLIGIGPMAPAEVLHVSDAIAISSGTEGNIARLTRRTSHQVHTLTLGATSDTTTISVPSGARLLAVSMNVNIAVVDDAGDDTWDATWLTGSSQGIVTGASPTLNTKVNVMFPGNVNDVTTATTQIRFSPNGGNFSDGVIEIVAYYESLTSLADL